MSHSLMNKPELKKFNENMIRVRIEKSMQGQPQDNIDATVANAIANQNAPVAKIIGIITLFITAGIALIQVLLFWLVQIIILRFLGGEENPVTLHKKKNIKVYAHRESLILAFLVFVPSVIHGVISVAISLFKDPNSFLNVLTIKDMYEQFAVIISIYGVFFSHLEVPMIVKNVLNDLTGPFFWWFVFICWFGLEKVWHISKKHKIIFLVLWFVLYQAFNLGIVSASGALF